MKGRAKIASVKNFILEDTEKEGADILLLGKIKEEVYNMDLHWPLNTLEASAIALSSFLYKNWWISDYWCYFWNFIFVMSRAEQLIYQKRAQEQKLSNMQTKLKQEFHQKEFAVWQNKGKNLEIQNQVKVRMNQARAQAQANLSIRRYLLSY